MKSRIAYFYQHCLIGIVIILILIFYFQCQNSISVDKTSESYFIFPLQGDHVHGPTVAELPNGNLVAAWFQGSGERWADDVQIMGSVLEKEDSTWSKPFVMADVEEFPDINPVLYLHQNRELFLFWYPVIANQWETSLPMFRRTTQLEIVDTVHWDWQDVIFVRPGDQTQRGIQSDDKFVMAVQEQLMNYQRYAQDSIHNNYTEEERDQYRDYWFEYKRKADSLAKGENMLRRGRISDQTGGYMDTILGYPISRRIGWQTKNKPVEHEGNIILPLYSDGMDASIFAITDNEGETWTYSNPILGGAGIQGTILKNKNGEISAFFRDNGPPPQRIQRSNSNDGGLTWSIARDTDLHNSGAGFDGVTLSNGDWLLVYNDTEEGRHRLVVALSKDDGISWQNKKYLENDTRGSKLGTSVHYPSVIQGHDGKIHVVYSYHFKDGTNPAKTIKYFAFDMEWLDQ